MSKFEREKGRRAERELVNLIREELGNVYGEELDKNWNQFERNRHDVTLGPFALEIKRYSQKTYQGMAGALWRETVKQAEVAQALPLLAVRLDRQGWRFTMAFTDLSIIINGVAEAIPFTRCELDAYHDWERDQKFTVTMPWEAFAYFSREYVPDFVALMQSPDSG